MSELTTAQAQLASVRASIESIEGRGQALSADGSSLQRGNLETLYAREKELLGRIARLQGGSGRAWKVVSGR